MITTAMVFVMVIWRRDLLPLVDQILSLVVRLVLGSGLGG